MRKLIACALFSAFISLAARAEIIPASRKTDWTPGTIVGVPGGIPTNRTIFANAVTDYGADNTGATDTAAQINAAIAACPPDQVVILPAGTYKVGSVVNGGSGFKDKYTLRGAGPDKTHIVPVSSAFTQIFAAGPSDNYNNLARRVIASGATKDSSSITLSDASGISVGNLIEISGDDPSYVHNNTGTQHTMSYMFRVTAVSSGTVTFSPKLPITISANPRVVVFNDYGSSGFVTGIGYEDFSYDGTGGNSVSDVFGLSQAWGCWIKNVRAESFAHRCIGWGRVLQNEVRHCTFLHGQTGSGGEGGDLIGNACWNLFEDDIIYDGGGIILSDGYWGVSGNVIGYSFIYGHHGADPSWAAADVDMNHGVGGNSFNLLEGNVIGVLQMNDGYFSGTSHNTVTRNFITGTHPSATHGLYCIYAKHYANYLNIVGNVLGTTAFRRTNNGLLDGGSGLAVGGFYFAPEVSGYAGGAYAGDGNGNYAQCIYELGFPAIGDSAFTGTGGPATPPDYSNTLIWGPVPDPPNNAFYRPLDRNVKATMARHGNFDYFNLGSVWETTNTNVTDYTDQSVPFGTYTDRAGLIARGVNMTGINFPVVPLPSDPGSPSPPSTFVTTDQDHPPDQASQLNDAVRRFYVRVPSLRTGKAALKARRR